MMIAGQDTSVGCGRLSSGLTLPVIVAWIGTPVPTPSAIFWPRTTRSPLATIGVAGSPRCWISGSHTSDGGGVSGSIGRAAVISLCVSGWIPPRSNVSRPTCAIA